jgi:hypothetical protein
MLDMRLLYELPIWVDGTLFLLLLLLAVESGFHMGLRRHRASGGTQKTEGSNVTLGAMLALLGLMLAFTYAFSLSRADMRKQAIVDDANAIGTAFLRADLGAEPGRSELRKGLLEYAQTRLISEELYGEALREAIDRSLQAQARLWPATKRALHSDVPGPIQASIVQSVNEVLDTHAIRVMSRYDRIPAAVFLLLMVTAAASLAVAAHNAGLNGNMNRWGMNTFALVLAAMMVVIVDFDRGKHGLIRVSNQALEAVVQDMQAELVN